MRHTTPADLADSLGRSLRSGEWDTYRNPDCRTCQGGESTRPSHDGSARCESGSLASGGYKSHCTCDTCF